MNEHERSEQEVQEAVREGAGTQDEIVGVPLEGVADEAEEVAVEVPRVEQDSFDSSEHFVEKASELIALAYLENETQKEALEVLKLENPGVPLTMDQVAPILEVINNFIDNIDAMEDGAAVYNADEDASISYQVLDAVKTGLLEVKTNVSNNLDPAGMMDAKSIKDVETTLNEYATAPDLEPEEAAERRDQVDRVKLTLSALDMSFDAFMLLNEGSDLGTFLAFLFDPINTQGKDGEPLNFGTESFDNVEAKIVPLPTMREKLKDTDSMANALILSAESINSEWKSANEDNLKKLYEEKDPSLLKDLLLDLYNTKVLGTGDVNLNKKRFRLFFTSSLMGDGESHYMNDSSFDFFKDLVNDGGSKLDSYWNLDTPQPEEKTE